MASLKPHEDQGAKYLLANPEQIPVYLLEKKWGALYALACYLHDDVPIEIASVDPAKYRTLRQQITEVRIGGWLRLDRDELASRI